MISPEINRYAGNMPVFNISKPNFRANRLFSIYLKDDWFLITDKSLFTHRLTIPNKERIFIQIHYKISFSASLSELGTDLRFISSQYMGTDNSLMYRYVYGNGCIITSESISGNNENPKLYFSHSLEVKLLKTIKEMIHLKYQDNSLCLQSIALEFYMSTAYLGKVFKNEEQVSISWYINDYRIKKAAELMDHSKLNIGAIATEVGTLCIWFMTENSMERSCFCNDEDNR